MSEEKAGRAQHIEQGGHAVCMYPNLKNEVMAMIRQERETDKGEHRLILDALAHLNRNLHEGDDGRSGILPNLEQRIKVLEAGFIDRDELVILLNTYRGLRVAGRTIMIAIVVSALVVLFWHMFQPTGYTSPQLPAIKVTQ